MNFFIKKNVRMLHSSCINTLQLTYLVSCLCAQCDHWESAFICSCITSLDFLVLPLLLKSIINGIKQLRFWRDGSGGFEAMFPGLLA